MSYPPSLTDTPQLGQSGPIPDPGTLSQDPNENVPLPSQDPTQTTATNGSADTIDQQIQAMLNASSPGTPPVVPGYNTTASSNPGAQDATGTVIRVGSYNITLFGGVNPTDTIPVSTPNSGVQTTAGSKIQALLQAPYSKAAKAKNTDTVQNQLEAFAGWSNTTYQQFRNQAYQAGLISSANAGKQEVLTAWQLVVEEGAKEGKNPLDVIQSATSSGWNAMSPTFVAADAGLSASGNAYNAPDSASTTNQTSYISYMDPATAQGTLADSFYRLLGRQPTQKEYQSFLNSLYQYEDQANTGKFEQNTTDKSGSASDGGKSTDTTGQVISERGIGTRGAEFLSGEAAMADPDYGRYQAATTYFHAFMQALSGPAAGMQAAGPTTTTP